jgi:hypothetical protein
VGGGYGGTSVERFAGVVRTADGEPTPWSLVVKVLRERSGERPHDTPYWRREVDAYRSGVLDDLPGGLSAPRVYDVETYPGDCCRLWLEEVDSRGRSLDAIADDWAELGRYVLGLTGDGAIDDVGVDRAGTVR